MTDQPPKRKQPTSFYLSKEALALLRSLAEETGLSQAAVLEVAIRQFAKKTRGRRQ